MPFSWPEWPSWAEFFPPTPRAAGALSFIYRLFIPLSLVQWTPAETLQAHGKTSVLSRFNLSGRYAWAAAESVGPVYLIYTLLALDPAVHARSGPSSQGFGTGLSLQCTILAALYVLHYLNRAVVTPLFLAPSMSPIHPVVTLFMMAHQFLNAGSIASWLVYTVPAGGGGGGGGRSTISTTSLTGLLLFALGLICNIRAENTLFALRRGAAKRKAKSEGKVEIVYDKVYVIPPAEGDYKYILFPHYVYEWLEWTGYYILAGAWGFGWGSSSMALWFLLVEIAVMTPRAVKGRRWYAMKFGRQGVGGRAAVIPGLL